MKTIKALNRWRRGDYLSNSDKIRIEDLLTNLKIMCITLAVGVVTVWLLSTSGCFEARVTAKDFMEEQTAN